MRSLAGLLWALGGGVAGLIIGLIAGVAIAKSPWPISYSSCV